MLEVAEQITKIPAELTQMNKRLVHRQMEVMGIRARHPGWHRVVRPRDPHPKPWPTSWARVRKQGLTGALQDRDEQHGDYRTSARPAHHPATPTDP